MSLPSPHRLSSLRSLRPSAGRPAIRQQQHVRLLAPRCFTSSPRPSATFPQAPDKGQTTLAPRDPRSKRWAELSAGQKVGRAASTGANLATILVGLVVTGAVFTFVFTDIVSPNSTTTWFNTTTDRIKNDARCRHLLGDGKIKAYGEPTSNRWARNRPLAARATKDVDGTEHIHMHFNVEGDLDRGVAKVHLRRRPGESEFSYQYLFLDVPGKERVELENAARERGKSGTGFLGVRWR